MQGGKGHRHRSHGDGHGHPHGHHEHGGRHRHRGRDGGPGRFYDGDELRLVILHLIGDTPRHGYDIIKQVEGLLSGAHAPSPGIVYPTLTLLEEMGLAEVAVEGTRKRYSITAEGKRELARNRAATDGILQRMKRAGEQHAHDRPAPILRAMENLKLVLRMRGGDVTKEQLAAITDIIDAAAKQIERL